MSDVTDPNTTPVFTTRLKLANRPRDLLFRDVAQASLEYEIESVALKRHINDRSVLVVLLEHLRRPGMDRAVILDTPCIDAASTQRAH